MGSCAVYNYKSLTSFPAEKHQARGGERLGFGASA